MSHLSQKKLDLFTNKILEDYDAKNPGTIFKEKIEIGNEDALLIQSNIARLREKRGEIIIGYKIDVLQKRLKKKWDLRNLHVVIFGKVNCTLAV